MARSSPGRPVDLPFTTISVLGHARKYVSTDIIRRILRDYSKFQHGDFPIHIQRSNRVIGYWREAGDKANPAGELPERPVVSDYNDCDIRP